MNITNKTHTKRWFFAESYNENWNQRAIELMGLFRKNEYVNGSIYKVAELGCGAYAPFHTHFNGKDGFEVQKFDIKKWDEDTGVLDLNDGDFSFPSTNISVFGGVLEYLNDIPSVLKKVMSKSDYILMSYAFVPSASLSSDRKFLSEIKRRSGSNGWRNHYSNKELVELISSVGIISAVGAWKKDQSLFLLRNQNLDSLQED